VEPVVNNHFQQELPHPVHHMSQNRPPPIQPPVKETNNHFDYNFLPEDMSSPCKSPQSDNCDNYYFLKRKVASEKIEDLTDLFFRDQDEPFFLQHDQEDFILEEASTQRFSLLKLDPVACEPSFQMHSLEEKHGHHHHQHHQHIHHQPISIDEYFVNHGEGLQI